MEKSVGISWIFYYIGVIFISFMNGGFFATEPVISTIIFSFGAPIPLALIVFYILEKHEKKKEREKE